MCQSTIGVFGSRGFSGTGSTVRMVAFEMITSRSFFRYSLAISVPHISESKFPSYSVLLMPHCLVYSSLIQIIRPATSFDIAGIYFGDSLNAVLGFRMDSSSFFPVWEKGLECVFEPLEPCVIFGRRR